MKFTAKFYIPLSKCGPVNLVLLNRYHLRFKGCSIRGTLSYL